MCHFNIQICILLTEEVCDAFSNLQILALGIHSFEHIKSGALNTCLNRSMLLIFKSEVKEIDPYLFMNTPEMFAILPPSNKLTYVDVKMFQFTKKLQTLNLNNNFLIPFNFREMSWNTLSKFSSGQIICLLWMEKLQFKSFLI